MTRIRRGIDTVHQLTGWRGRRASPWRPARAESTAVRLAVAHDEPAKPVAVVLRRLNGLQRLAALVVVGSPFQDGVTVVGIVHGERQRQDDSVSLATTHLHVSLASR